MAALAVFGTPIVYYSAVDVSAAHGPATAIFSCFIWYWLRTYRSSDYGRWVVLGLLLGTASMFRWQLVAFFAIPLGESLFLEPPRSVRGSERFQRALKRLAAMGVAGSIAFLPQMLCWRCVYGSWLVQPIPGLVHHWLNPAFWAVLCSQNKSLFYWTPLTCMLVIGAVYACISPCAFADRSRPPSMRPR